MRNVTICIAAVVAIAWWNHHPSTQPANAVQVAAQPAPVVQKPVVEAPRTGPDVLVDGPYSAGFWQSERNGATGPGHCDPDKAMMEHIAGQPDVLFLDGIRDKHPLAATWPVHYARSTDNTWWTYLGPHYPDGTERRNFRVTIVANPNTQGVLVDQRIELYDATGLREQFGSVQEAEQSWNGIYPFTEYKRAETAAGTAAPVTARFSGKQ